MKQKQQPYLFYITLLYGVFFAIAFYRNFAGITFPLITILTIIFCGLFLKKAGIPWKKSSWYYALGASLLGISMVLTNNTFVIVFNTIGILLLLTVLMLRQFYDDKCWNFGGYFCNLIFLYVCMITELASPLIDASKYLRRLQKKEEKKNHIKYIIYGILIAVPLLFLVILLLSSADQIFSVYVGKAFLNLWDHVIFSPDLFLVIFLMLLGFFGFYSFLSSLTLENMPGWEQKKQKKNPLTAIVFTAPVTSVYGIFSVIQIIFLFTGGKLGLPKGYTYAQYAHQGFFQLLFVCMINLVMVILCLAIFERSKILNVILLLCSACTYIMIASSVCRMILYISTYHLSFLRILVLWFLGLLSVIMAGVVLTIIKKEFPLFRYTMSSVTIFYLIFSFGRTDRLIAEYNVSHMQDMSQYDISYLCRLSLDAAPVLKNLKLEHTQHEKINDRDIYQTEKTNEYDFIYTGVCGRCRLDKYFHEILDQEQNEDIRKWNLSQWQAYQAAEVYFD